MFKHLRSLSILLVAVAFIVGCVPPPGSQGGYPGGYPGGYYNNNNNYSPAQAEANIARAEAEKARAETAKAEAEIAKAEAAKIKE